MLDAYSRMIVGWQLATHMRAELVLDALEMANGLRRPAAGLIAHCDRGSQPDFKRSSQHCQLTERIVVRQSVVVSGDFASAIAEAA